MAYQPQFTEKPFAVASIGTANTNTDGSGKIVIVAEGGTDGARVDGGQMKAHDSTSNGMIRLFLRAQGADDWVLYDEIDVTAVASPGGTTQTWAEEWVPPGGLLMLRAGAMLGASTHVGESFSIMLNGGQL